MDQQLFQTLTTIAGILIAAIGFCVAWWVNNLWAMVKGQQEQITNLSVKLAENYAPRAELEKTFERIFNLLEEIRKEVRHA